MTLNCYSIHDYQVVFIVVESNQLQECLVEGESARFQCFAGLDLGLLQWKGFGNICPDPRTTIDNKIALIVLSNCMSDQTGYCRSYYFGNLICPSENITEAVSFLIFTANYNIMNGKCVRCVLNHTNTQYPIRIGGKLYNMYWYVYIIVFIVWLQQYEQSDWSVSGRYSAISHGRIARCCNRPQLWLANHV